MTIPNNPPAFPRSGRGDNRIPEQGGMTLRDWFASQALVGFLSGASGSNSVDPEVISTTAYRVADSMLRAREREGDDEGGPKLSWDDIAKLNT